MNENRILKAGLKPESELLEISWRDGHDSSYPLRYLRSHCPCAACRNDREEARKNPFRVLPAGQRPASAGMANIEGVGQYGLRFVWNDGHNTGIYTLEYLRGLCPCPVCTEARVPDETPYVHGIYIPGG
jgi:DUF971 family protein